MALKYILPRWLSGGEPFLVSECFDGAWTRKTVEQQRREKQGVYNKHDEGRSIRRWARGLGHGGNPYTDGMTLCFACIVSPPEHFNKSTPVETE